jgi:O-antigen/teichoic acid export membrane protein
VALEKYIKNTMVYTLLGFIPLASSFFLTPLFTNHLSKEQYGFIALATIFQTYLSFIITLGIDSGFSRFYFSYNRKPALTSALFSTTLLSMSILSVIVLVIFNFSGKFLFAFFFADSRFDFSEYGNLIFVNSVFTMMYSLYLQYYRDRENIRNFVALSLTFLILFTTGSVMGLYFIGGAKGVIIGRTAGTTLTMLLFIIAFYSRNRFILKWSYAKRMYVFGYPMVFYSLLSTTFDSIDRFLINHYESLSKVGEYNMAVVAVSVIGIIINSLNSALGPSVFRIFSETRTGKDVRITQVYRSMLAASILASTLCIAVAAPVIHTMINAGYHGAIIYIPPLAAAFIFRAYYIFYSNPLFFYYKTFYLPVINLLSVVIGIVSGYLFLQWFGILGICLTVFMIKGSQALFAFLFAKRAGFYRDENDLQQLNMLFLLICMAVVFIIVRQVEKGASDTILNTVPFLVSVVYIFRLYRKGYFNRAASAVNA